MLYLTRFWGVTLRNSDIPDVIALPVFLRRFLNLGGRGGLLKNLNTQIYIKKHNIYNKGYNAEI
jgi:hypothetical protein